MPSTIQTMTISGSIIETGRWRVNDLVDVHTGDMMQISLPIKDRKLMGYIRNKSKFECMLERGKDGQGHSVILALRVKQIRHMFDGSAQTESDPPPVIESMCVITPMDRFVESVLLFLLDKKKCDPRFIAILRSPVRQDRQEE